MNRERTARARRVLFEQLERRVLLSADPVLDALEGRTFDTEALADSSHDAGLGPAASGISNSLADSQTAESDDAHRTTEVYFIDSRVPDALTLVEDLRDRAGEGIEFVLLDARLSGIEQVSDSLDEFRNLDAVHIISHGTQGAVQLGSTILDLDALQDNSEAIRGWGDAFTADGDLLIYGGNLAASEEGQDLVDAMARLTETDVAASDDPTGHSGLGGDWGLEYRTGNQHHPLVAIDDNGDFLVAWTSQDKDGDGVYAQRFDAHGTPKGSEFRVNEMTPGNQKLSSVEATGDGSYVVRWTAENSSGITSAVYERHFGANGDALTGDVRVEVALAIEEAAYSATSVDVVLIDSQLPDSDSLAQALLPGGRLFMYDGSHDGAADVLGQVIQLAESSDAQISSLSILAHGAPGAFALGSDWITVDTLDNTAWQWQRLNDVLVDGGNVLLFGCNVIDGAGTGQGLLDRLTLLTGGDVFASDDVTGAGGDWQLEVASWSAESELVTRLAAPLDGQALSSYASNLTVTVSGTVYTDEGTTNIGANKTVRIAVNGTDFVTTAETDGGGAYSISGLTLSPGDVLTVYLEDESENGVSVTVSDGTGLPGLDLYRDRLVIQGNVTNADLTTAMVASEADISNIYSTDGANNLTMGAGKELFISSGSTFNQSADVTTTALDVRGTYVHGAETLTVNGSYTHSQGTFTGGSGTFDVNGNFAINGGTFTAPSGTLAVSRSFTQTGSPTWDANGGTVLFDGSVAANASVDASSVTFAEVAINRTANGSSNYTFTIAAGTTIPLGNSPVLTLVNTYNTYPNYNRLFHLVNNGVITTDTSGTLTTRVDGTLTNNGTITANSATAWTMNGSIVNNATITADSVSAWTVNGNFTNNSTASLSSASVIDFNWANGGAGTFVNNAGSSIVTAALPTWTLNGSLVVASGTLFPNNATVTFDGALPANASVDASSVTFAEVAINRTANGSSNYTFTIAAGTTIPLGNSPVLTLVNTYNTYPNYNRLFHLVNNGVITTDTSGTLTTRVDGTLTNNGTITANSATAWTMNGSIVNNATITADSVSAWTVNGNFTNNSTASLSSASVIDFNWANGGAGTFVNNAGSSIVTAALPTWTLNGSLVVASGTLFPNNATVTFDGALPANASVDASSVTFAEVAINRTANGSSNYTFTIAAGTTIPLGNSPVLTLVNTYNTYPNYNRLFHLVNNGVITTDTSGTLTTRVDGTLTNNGTITANSATAWTMNGSIVNNATITADSVSAWTVNGNFTNNSTASLSSASVIDFNWANGGAGTFVNNAGSSIVTAALPTWTLNGSLVVASGTLFPNNATVTFDGALPANASVDASSVTFAEVAINRTANGSSNYTFTIAAGTTIPLGNSPVLTLVNTYNTYPNYNRLFHLVNNGVITTDTSGTLTTRVDGTLTNNGTITANSATAWTMNGSIVNNATITADSVSAWTVNGNFTNNSTASLSSASVIDFNWANGGAGTFVNNAGSSIVTAALPTWTLNGSLVVASGTLFPNNATVTFDGALPANASVDASSVTFAEVAINRTANGSSNYTFTIAAGTTIPLGNSPVLTLVNTYNTYPNYNRLFHLVNNGVITTDTSGTLTTRVDGTLTNNGTITANSATAWTMNGSIVNNATITADSVSAWTVNGNFTNNSTASLSSASVIDFNWANGGAGTFVNNAGSSIVTAALPTWTLNGSLVVASGTLFPNNATVTFDGALPANASVDASSVTFAEVAINRTANGSSNYTFTIAAGTTIPLGNSPVLTLVNTYNTYPNYNRLFHLVNNGVITTDTSGTLTTRVDGTLTNNGTITANSATAWTMNGSIVNNATITADSVSAWTVNGNFTNNSTASLSSASVIDFNWANGGAGTFVNNAGSSIVTAALPTWTLNGSLVVASGTLFPNNATVTFDGALPANASVDASSVTFAEVAINRTANGSSNYTFTIAAGTTIPLGNSPVLTLVNTYNTYPNYNRLFHLVNNGVITTDTSGTLTTRVDGTLTNNGTITANSATAWTMNGSIVNNATITADSVSAWTVNGNFTNNSTASLSSASVIDFNWANGGAGTFVNNAGSSIVTAALPTWTLNGSLVVASGTLFPNNATVTFDGALPANASVDASSVTFAEVAINRTANGSSNYTFTIAAGTTIPLGNSPVLTLVNTYNTYPNYNRLFHLVNNGTIGVGTGTFIESVDGTFTNNGTISTKTVDLSGTIVNGATSTVEFIGDGDASNDQFTLTDWGTSFANLTINATDGTNDVFVLGANVDTNKDLTILSGTLDANGVSSKNITVGGNWTNTVGAAGFLARSGKVDFDGDPASRAISGSTTFYDLEISSASAQTVTFQSGETQTVSNHLTFAGAGGNLLTLTPSVAATDWYLVAPSSQTVQYVRSSYSDASGGAIVSASDGTSSDGGNNTNWNFHAPTVDDQGFTVNENANDGTSVGTVVANDSDSDDTLSFAIIDGNTSSAFEINSSSGEITVDNSAVLDFETTPTFNLTVEINDIGLLSDTATITITLANVDDAATTTGDVSYSGNEGDAVAGDLNATDVEGLTDGTYFTVTTPATNGTAAIDPVTGAWTFTPTDPTWFGSDSFTVTVTDDLGGTTTQVVSITLANVDDPATITGDISYSGNEGDAVAGDLNATDVEGLTDGTYFTVTTPATNGTAAIDPVTGAWTFTPTDPTWFGSDSFTVTVTDDLGGTTTQVVSITLANVDDPATITGDISYSGNEGDAVAGDLNATDVEGLTDGTYFTVTTPATNGTAAIDPVTGAWTFTPTDPTWFGSDSFTVTVTDDLGGTTTQVVSITLANVDDPATITGDISYSGNEGDAVAGDLNATDVEGLSDGTYFSVTTPAANGTAAIGPTTGAWTFTPTDPNWFGSDAFTVTVTDDLGGITTQAVGITLANVNDAPVATADGYTTVEDMALTATLGVDDLLANDTDVDGGSLTVGTTPVGDVTKGTLVLNADGSFTYTPADNYNGSDSFTYAITDLDGETSTATVTITVTPVNDTPLAASDSYSTNEDTAVTTGNVLSNDNLGDGPTTITAFDAVSANGGTVVTNGDDTFRYLPAAGFTGTDSFTYTITDQDGESTTATVTLTVAPASAGEEEPSPSEPPPPASSSPSPETGVPIPGNDDSDSPQASDDDNDELFPLSESASTARGSMGSAPPAEEEPSVDESPGEEAPAETVEAGDETANEPDGNTPTDDALADDGQSQPQVQTADSRPRVPEPRATGISGLNTVNKPPLMASPEFLTALDEIRAALEGNAPLAEEHLQVLAAGVTVTGISLTAGSVTWAIRGGSLLTTLLAGIPAWKGFDPLPVVLMARPRRKAREQDKEKDKPDDVESKAARLFEADDEVRTSEASEVKTL